MPYVVRVIQQTPTILETMLGILDCVVDWSQNGSQPRLDHARGENHHESLSSAIVQAHLDHVLVDTQDAQLI
jgi:hypothetical protein